MLQLLLLMRPVYGKVPPWVFWLNNFLLIKQADALTPQLISSLQAFNIWIKSDWISYDS